MIWFLRAADSVADGWDEEDDLVSEDDEELEEELKGFGMEGKDMFAGCELSVLGM